LFLYCYLFLAVGFLNVSLDINSKIIDLFAGNSVLFLIVAIFIYYLVCGVGKIEGGEKKL